MHIVVPFALFFSTLTATAQIPGGPLTIAAAAQQGHAHTHLSTGRGGTPYNDLCQNAVVHALPPDGSITLTGDNTGATDTEDFGNPVSWEAFTIDTCSTVTVSYCGTAPVFELVYSILIVGCPDFIANVQNNGTTFCDDGNVIVVYENLAAGTYYVPVLLTTGAQGPYTITLSSDVCDTPPLNDICVNATMLTVVQDCALGMVGGNNANAVINSAPPCATTTSQFQDVWYQFDSGTNSEVVISLDPGTIGDLGVEVRAACGGPSVFCAIGDTSYTLAVDPGTNYRVRVFSNNDFGFGGTFGICITVPSACDAGSVALVGGGGSVTACANGGDPIGLEHILPGGGDQSFLVTDPEDTIVGVLPGDVLDPALLSPGEYRVWGLSVNGELSGATPGSPLSGLVGSSCLDLSDGFITVTIEVCEGLPEAGPLGWDLSLIASAQGPSVRWAGAAQPIDVELFDARGASLYRKTLSVHPGLVFGVVPEGMRAAGLYLVRVSGAGGPPLVRRVFVH